RVRDELSFVLAPLHRGLGTLDGREDRGDQLLARLERTPGLHGVALVALLGVYRPEALERNGQGFGSWRSVTLDLLVGLTRPVITHPRLCAREWFVLWYVHGLFYAPYRFGNRFS